MVRTQGLVSRFVFGGVLGYVKGTLGIVLYSGTGYTQVLVNLFMPFVLVRNIVDYFGQVAKTGEK